MKIIFIASCFLCFISFSGFAEEKQPYKPSQDNLRIKYLLPLITFPLCVEPALPKDFKSGYLPVKSGLPTNMIWGPTSIIKSVFEKKAPLEQALIMVDLANNATQEELGHCALHPEEFLHNVKMVGLKDIETEMLSWGDYPVYAVKAKIEGKTVHFAWVGLNYENRTLLFCLLYPLNRNEPSKEDLELWSNFLHKTKQLPQGECLRALGFDMQVGCTFYHRNHMPVQFIAEQRTRDQKLRIVIIPQNSDVLVRYEEFYRKPMETPDWHYREPTVKLPCTFYKYVKRDWEMRDDQTITILIKSVEEFSLTDEEVEQSNGNIIYEKECASTI